MTRLERLIACYRQAAEAAKANGVLAAILEEPITAPRDVAALVELGYALTEDAANQGTVPAKELAPLFQRIAWALRRALTSEGNSFPDSRARVTGPRAPIVPYGIRTRVANVKGWSPGPLDERDAAGRNAEEWCPGAESNHRHCDFQSHALPTELPGHRPRRRGRH